MKALLEEAGWKYRNGYGSQSKGQIDLVALDTDTSRMWVVAQK